MPTKPIAVFIAGIALFGAAAIAGAQSTDKLAEKYAPLVGGSKADARTLVDGLRTSSDFTIGNTRFGTPTKTLGNGEVNIALSLTEASLSQQKIGSPTPDQLKAALEPILRQRADGKGWGEIANSMGVRLGDVMRSDKSRGQDRVARNERMERRSARLDKPDRMDKPERAERAERPERPERPEKPERPGR